MSALLKETSSFGDYLQAQVRSGEANRTAQIAIEKSCQDNQRLGLKPSALEMAIAEARGVPPKTKDRSFNLVL